MTDPAGLHPDADLAAPGSGSSTSTSSKGALASGTRATFTVAMARTLPSARGRAERCEDAGMAAGRTLVLARAVRRR